MLYVGDSGGAGGVGGAGGGSTTKDIGNKNPSTKWSPTATQTNRKYELTAKLKGTKKQSSKNNPQMNSRYDDGSFESKTGSITSASRAKGDVGNDNPKSKVTYSPSSKDTSTQVRTSGGDLALRARASGKGGGGGRGITRSAVAAGSGFIARR